MTINVVPVIIFNMAIFVLGVVLLRRKERPIISRYLNFYKFWRGPKI